MAPLSASWRAGSLSKRRYSQYIEKPTGQLKWEVGEIAFLRNAFEFNAEDHAKLLGTKYLHINATCHPVIILGRSPDHSHYLITTISAYGSGHFNSYMPPWEQVYHQYKEVEGFRAFEGSARPGPRHPYLKLADGRSCPKVRTSWVYMHHVFVVPATTLKIFDKSPHRLRMAPESLADLLADMKARSRMYRTGSNDPRIRPSTGSSNSWRNTVNQAPQPKSAPAKTACGIPTPPTSSPSSPETVKSQPENPGRPNTGLLTPPPSPKGPQSSTKAPPLGTSTKPLWSAVAMGKPPTPPPSSASPGRSYEAAPIAPKWHQQEKKQEKKQKQNQQLGKGNVVYSSKKTR